MKHYLLFLLLLINTIAYSQTTHPIGQQGTVKTTHKTTQVKSAPNVYVCVGGSAYAYHSSESCAGLNRCTHTIKAISFKEAEGNYNRKPGKKCY